MDPKRAEIGYRAALPMAKIAIAPMARVLRWGGGFAAIMVMALLLGDRRLEPTVGNVAFLLFFPLVLIPMIWFAARDIHRTKRRGVGACLFSSAIAIIAVWSAIVVGTRESPRQRSAFFHCRIEMRMIGQAMAAYVSAHGEWPASLRDLANAQPPQQEFDVICPASPAVETMDWKQRWPAGVAASYIYICPVETNPPKPVIVLYEDLYHFDGRGMNLLMSDGKVQQLRDEAAVAKWKELSESEK